MELVNGGRVNRLHCRNDLESRHAFRKRETLKNIEREIEQLVEKKRGIEEELTCLHTTLSHNHGWLPNEVLGRIFVLLAQEYGPVHFPIRTLKFRTKRTPPQLAISHVCSHWRGVALHTPELWSNAQLTYPRTTKHHAYLNEIVYLRHWRRWVMRAGTFPVTLWIDFPDRSFCDGVIPSVLKQILLPFQVKRLVLSLTYKSFVELSKLTEATFSGLTDFDLELMLRRNDMDIDENLPQHLTARLRSVTFRGYDFDAWIDRLFPIFPWGQLQSLDFGGGFLDDLDLAISILHEVPMLQVLRLAIRDVDVVDYSKELTMSSLQDLSLEIELSEDTEANEVLRIFTCPSLNKLNLALLGSWTIESFEILKRQYNMQGLQEIQFDSFPLPISSILRNAPALRVLSVRQDAILDDLAIIGISNATLGRSLVKMDLPFTCDVNEVIDMIEKRMKTVDELIRDGCSWREDVTMLRDINVHGIDRNERQKFEGIIAKLTGRGIRIDL